MFKVAYPLAALAAFGVGAFVLIEAQPKPQSSWKDSVAAAAESMRVTLSPECLAAIDALVLARGFERAAVTNRGSVVIRDSAGRDEWVCR